MAAPSLPITNEAAILPTDSGLNFMSITKKDRSDHAFLQKKLSTIK